jgi:hypothetical protein
MILNTRELAAREPEPPEFPIFVKVVPLAWAAACHPSHRKRTLPRLRYNSNKHGAEGVCDRL